MVFAVNILKSKKRLGKYEKPIINRLSEFFSYKGYEVLPHSRLNFAWGSILSDVDLLLLKDNRLTYIEVKSHRDKIDRAPEQIERIKDFVDYAYVATEKELNNWIAPQVGLILVRNECINIIRVARKFQNTPKFLSILTLKKKCLAMFFNIDDNKIRQIEKYDLAQNVYTRKAEKCSRKYLREIVTCGESCSVFCPIRELAD